MRIYYNKRVLFLGLGFIALMMLTGCSATLDYNIDRTQWWNYYGVGPLSDLIDFLASWMNNQYGWAILILTVMIRLVIFPLTLKQYQSTKQARIFRPELVEIQKKYKADPAKLREEMMKLYQKHGVNPMGGCLPMLVQMPILFALYHAILGNDHIRDHDFLWLQLGEADPFYILPIVAAVTTFLQQEMMKSQIPANMQTIMLIFPVMIFVVSLNFPSALVLYWVYSNLITIVQNYFLYRNDKDTKVPA